MNGTGTGGYVSTTIDAGTGTLATLSGGVQIAGTNIATVVLGAKSGWNMIVNGIISPGGSSNTSPVLIANTPAGSGKGGFTFEGTSNYYGPTYLGNNAGTIVKCAAANTLSPYSVMTFGSPSTIGQGADLDLAGSDQTIGGLSSLTGATGEITNSATSGTNTLIVNQSTTTTYGLRMIDSTLGAKNALTKSGTGILTMTGINTYTGATTVSGGSLFVNGGLSAASAVTVAAVGTIGGSGTAAGTLSLSGTVSPGAGISPSAGNLTTGAQTWNDGALYKFDVLNVSGTAGTSTTWDLLTSTAAVDVSTGNYTIDLTGNPTGFSSTSSYSWTFLTAASITGFSSSRFTILTTNFTPAFSGVFSVSQVGNTLVIKYCPPATASNTGPYIPGQTISLTSGPSGQTSYAWSGPNSFTSSTENPTRASASSIMTGTYTVTITGSNGCSDTANTFVSVNALGDYVWTGGAGTSVWTTTTNWSPTSPAGGPSGCSENVIIPVSSIYPVLTAATTIGNTIVHAGAQVTLNASLSVCGTLVGGISSPANFLGASHLVMTGTGRQLDSGMINVNYLEINNTGTGVWSLGAVSINNALIMTNGNFTDNTGGSVTLVSNASGDAYLDNFTSGTAGNYYWNLTVQRYISNTANGYRDLGAPVLTNDNCLNSAYPITGQNDVECWYAYSPYPNLQIYDESLIIPSANGSVFGHWKSYTNLNSLLYPMTGYAFRTYLAGTYTISFTGTPNNGSYNASITHTTSAIPANDGWNFLSNPYPSPIKWSLVKAMNAAVANGEYYVYNTTGEYTGNWGTFNGTTGVNGAVDEIAIAQGFFVQAPSSTTFTMDNTVRTGNTSGLYFGASPLLDNEVRLVLSGGANSDEIVTYTDPQATNGYDPDLDAVKMPAGSTVGISYSMPGHDYAINVMNTINEQTELPLSITVADTGSYTLNATMLNTPGLTAYLRDAQSRQSISLTDLASGPITLALNGGQTYSGRFSVVFRPTAVVTTGITNTGASATRIYSYGDKVYIERSNADAASISVTNLLGQEVSSLSTNTQQTEFEMPAVQPWYAIVKVTEQSGKVTVAKVLINNNQ
jgi:autotransporter-associated beta strand protein